MPKALAKAMRAVFTEEQLATCSFKGGITTIGDPRVCLPEAEREAVIGNNLEFKLYMATGF
ncbi:hypothetical protein DPMN_014133 [Dreissena polymorpha]|uniref:Uncharacterized protein n=1 Tax=Dreissena polymorpha TaxID=45954 RepID=A0A9D4NA70_DREPO|nr:hypothetical protein DPMN_014133 [Dreissena polymorpha]